MPLSPFRAMPKGSRWRSAFLCQLLTSALSVAATEPGHAQPAPGAGGNAAAGATKPALTFTAGIDASETVSSNGRGTPRAITTASGKSGPDEITQMRLNLNVRDHTAQFNGDLAYELAGSAFVRNSNLDHLSHNLTATSQTVLIPEHLELQARAFAREIYVNVLGTLGASNRPIANGPNSGLRQTFGYNVAPDLKFRFGDFATSETTVTQGGVFLSSPKKSQAVTNVVPGEDIVNTTTTYGATEKIASGTDFARLNWALSGTGQKTQRKLGDMSEASAIANLKYAVSREFKVTGSVGYETITSAQKLTHNLQGLLVMGGFDYSPSPDLQLTAQAGRQFNYPSYTGNLSYKLTPMTTLVGSLTDSVTTPAQRLLTSLNSLGVNAQGQFVNTSLGGTGLNAFDPAPIDSLGISNNISRFRSANLSLAYGADRTHYRLTAFGTIRDRLTVSTTGNVPPRTESTGATFSASRQMTPQITSTVALTYTVQNVLGGRTNLLRGSFDMTYDMTMSTHIYMRASYLHRLSSTALVAVSPLSGSLSDTIATIGLRQDL